MMEFYLGDDIGFIIPCESGIKIQAQTGGYACHQQELQGAFVPLVWLLAAYDLKKAQEAKESRLQNYFFDGPHRGWCEDGINEEDADFLDSILSEIEGKSEILVLKILVNREKMKESHEAWVHVKIDGRDAIFTWPTVIR